MFRVQGKRRVFRVQGSGFRVQGKRRVFRVQRSAFREEQEKQKDWIPVCTGMTEKNIQAGLQKLIASEKPVFEAILQGLSPHQRLLLKAVALEPPEKILAGSYIQKHGLGSTGGVQHSSKQLEDLDLIERRGDPELWQLVDPILALWLKDAG